MPFNIYTGKAAGDEDEVREGLLKVLENGGELSIRISSKKREADAGRIKRLIRWLL